MPTKYPPGETPDTGTFTLHRSGGVTSQPLVVYYRVGGTANFNSCGCEGVDYLPPLGNSVTFDANETDKDLTITPVYDNIFEHDETVIVTLLYFPDGTVTGTPTYDIDGTADTATVTIHEGNRAPVARPDHVFTDDHTPLTIDVLANDTDAEYDPLTITQVTSPSSGTVTLNGQSVWYTPVLNAFGAFTFSYTISDGHGGSSSSTVTVTVDPQAPSIQSFSNDTGVSGTDRITNAQNLSFFGMAMPNSVVSVYFRGEKLGSVDCGGNGAWWFDYSRVSLPPGINTFTATASIANNNQQWTSAASAPFAVTVDITRPTISLQSTSGSFDATPEFHVVATDDFGTLPKGTRVFVDVDLNHDFQISPNEMGYGWGDLVNGQARLEFSQPLVIPSAVWLRGRVEDVAGNIGISNWYHISLLETNPQHKPAALLPNFGWGVRAEPLGLDPLGNLQLVHALDLDTSPGIGTQTGGMSLVYNSSTVNVRPIIQVIVQTPNDVTTLPAILQVTLYWDKNLNGVIDGVEGNESFWNFGSANALAERVGSYSYSTSGLNPGDLITLAVQVPFAVATGRYTWGISFSTSDDPTGNGSLQRRAFCEGQLFAVSQTDSSVGPGWGLSGLQKLVFLGKQGPLPAGVMRIDGSGQTQFYKNLVTNGIPYYESPTGDPGRLAFWSNTANGPGYAYTLPSGDTWWFDTNGRLRSWLNPLSGEEMDYTYTAAGQDGIVDDLQTFRAIDCSFA
jgi:hypothetical protein